MCERKEAIKSLFASSDTNHDGKLSEKEITKFLAKMCPEMDGKTIAEETVSYFANNDKNADKMLTLEEFSAAFDKKNNKEATDAELKGCFKSFDKDGSGYIERGELIALLKAKKNWSDAKCEEAVRQCDIDGDGRVNYNEYLKNFKS